MVQNYVRHYKLLVAIFFMALLASVFEYFQPQRHLKISKKITQFLNLAFPTSLLTQLALVIGASHFSNCTLHHATSLIT